MRAPQPEQFDLLCTSNPMLFNHVLKTEEQKLLIQKEGPQDKSSASLPDFLLDQATGKRLSKAKILQMAGNGAFSATQKQQIVKLGILD